MKAEGVGSSLIRGDRGLKSEKSMAPGENQWQCHWAGSHIDWGQGVDSLQK